MKLEFSIHFCSDQGDKFFGEGPYRLLCGIRARGSLRAAAQDMGMAYTKAFHMLKRAESCCGFPLCRRTIGGEGGGGSVLTQEAEDLLTRYEGFRRVCTGKINTVYREYFGDLFPLISEDQPPHANPS